MSAKLLQSVLKQSFENKKLIGIRLYGEEEALWCGYVMDFNESFVKIQHYTKYGKPDGLIIEQFENVESIEFEIEYLQALQHLVKNHEKLDTQENHDIEPDKAEDWPVGILKQLDINTAIGLEFNNDFKISGFLYDYDDMWLSMICVDDLGKNEGKHLYKIEDIATIHIDRMEERKRKLLWNWRYD